MSISQISPNSLATNSPYVNPSAKTTETQAGAIQQGSQDAQKPAKAAQTDTVTISQQALQMTGGTNNSKPEDTQSSTSNNNGGNSNPNPNLRQPGSFSAQA
ncbi:MAG: hypothetical protein OEL57_09365 [Trichlorobacter sp.]|uniref:hypothetical protein n=1 Tax=Trichlorobacter sp. TaxID=2911007 RepID=UPI0025627E69|nr:hypothetical protein [Trichlorobacter sp.]MDK9718099.1 hypothetical protein [Trichlorobacter sp.]